MRSLVVVVVSPALDNGRSFSQVVEHLHVETLVAELAVEALPVRILPRTTRLDIVRFDLPLLQPL